MKISLNWLRELLDRPSPLAAEEAASILTRQGLEVEGTTAMGREMEGVLVAEVLAIRPHPKADKLRLVTVRAGIRQEEVVCGAPNVPEAGGKICWAVPGAKLPGGKTLQAREVRGVISPGMLCGESELGFSTDDSGLLVLASDAPSGADLATYVGARDDIFELNITPNRGDALSHLGVARELAAHLGCGVRLPSVTGIPETSSGSIPEVIIADTDGCYRYIGRALTGLVLGPSPIQMRLRLAYCGMRAISNVVDVTNYVLLEVGHPLHAFDAAKLLGKVEVRRARAGETLVTLDGQSRALVPEDLLITDGTGPIALAGVMGGAATEVSATTQSIFLEAATFDPRSIRKTAKRLGLSSEASYRFERGVDEHGLPFASLRAASLLAQVAGGRVLANHVDTYPRPRNSVHISLTKERLDRVSGQPHDLAQAMATLTRLGFACSLDHETLVAQAPSYRMDVSLPEDLVEEILRMGEYEKPAKAQRIRTNATSMKNPESIPDRLRYLLAGAGLSEIVSWAFVPRTHLAIISEGGKDPVLGNGITVKNPISADYEVMRTSLLPGLAAALARNLARGVPDPWLFEVGPVIRRSGEDTPVESNHAAGLIAGRRGDWLRPGEPIDFFDLKGIVENVLRAFMANPPCYKPAARIPFLHPGISAQIHGDIPLGLLGQLHPGIAQKLGIEVPAYYFEIDVNALKSFGVTLRSVAPPRFPAVTRDISFWIAEGVSAAEQQAALASAKEPLLEDLAVLEDFRDPRYVPPGKKGMLWSLTYRSTDRTLTDEEVDAAHGRVRSALVSRLEIQVR